MKKTAKRKRAHGGGRKPLVIGEKTVTWCLRLPEGLATSGDAARGSIGRSEYVRSLIENDIKSSKR